MKNNLKEIGTTMATVTEVKTVVDGSVSIKISIPASAIELGQELLKRFVNGNANCFVSFIDHESDKKKKKEIPNPYQL